MPTFSLAVSVRFAVTPSDDVVQEVVAMDDEQQLVWRAEP